MHSNEFCKCQMTVSNSMPSAFQYLVPVCGTWPLRFQAGISCCPLEIFIIPPSNIAVFYISGCSNEQESMVSMTVITCKMYEAG